eukprot:jgi/Psemu1/44329/gm1.44329_g
MTGNRTQGKIVGSDLFLLAIFVTIHPDASHEEMATFIYNEQEGGDICKRLSGMEVMMKRLSTEAYQQAFTPANIHRCDEFWKWEIWYLYATNKQQVWAHFVLLSSKEARTSIWTQKLTVLPAIKPGNPWLPPAEVRGSSMKPH